MSREVKLSVQFSNSTKLQSLFFGLVALYDSTLEIEQFYEMFYNFRTASGEGLDWWGTKLGTPRSLRDYPSPGDITLLDDDDYRTVMEFNLLLFQSGSSVYDINVFLSQFFEGRGTAYCIDVVGVPMTIRYFFDFVLTPLEFFLLRPTSGNGGTSLRPTGALVQFTQVPNNAAIFGFEGQDLGVYDHSVFFGG